MVRSGMLHKMVKENSMLHQYVKTCENVKFSCNLSFFSECSLTFRGQTLVLKSNVKGVYFYCFIDVREEASGRKFNWRDKRDARND